MMLSRRLAAAIAAGALTFAGSAAISPVAFAQVGTETPLPKAPAAPAGTINPNAQVSLTIKKYLGEVGDTSTGLNGSQFKIQKISDIDLTTQAGWETLAGRTALKPGPLTDITTVTTANGGTATLTTAENAAFTVGAYLVTEQNRAGYSTAAPFIVTLPFSNSDGTWNYAQTVSPKNQNVQPNKQADDNQAVLGGTMTYTINAPVPGGAMDRFGIQDPMKSGLQLDADSAVVTTTGAQAVDLQSGDYTVSYDNNTLTVNFARSGLDKLEAARKTDPTLQVSVKFTAKVVSVPANGTITNTATVLLPNKASVTTDDPTNGPTSTTYGNLTITKTGGDADKLTGAQFQVYQCQQQDGKYQLLGEPLTLATAADNSTSGKTLTVASNGTQATAQAFGLPASSFSGGATGNVANTYCALETKAPEGFVRDPEPRVLTYTAKTGAVGTFTVSVNNVKDSIIGQLPATGAWGIVLVFLVGLALLARGLYTSYKDNKAQSA